MPRVSHKLHPVTKDGKVVGWQAGSRGKVYKGKDAKKKATKQAEAVYASGWHSKTKKK